jgi:catechol 2,3-dioxygenase-like lactoylglutathione lyase family enzyme
MRPKAIDHVAFWVADREAIVQFLLVQLGLRVIDRQEDFTLLGTDARRFKLTLFDAEGPREPGTFDRLVLRVSDLDAARERLPPGTPGTFDAGEGLRIQLVEAETDADYDLDHVVLRSSEPATTAQAYERFGFRRVDEHRVAVADAGLVLIPGSFSTPLRPLLNHLAVLVDSASEHVEEAKQLGIAVESVVDAPNTYAAFLSGPEGTRIEYVEHKPSFSLR